MKTNPLMKVDLVKAKDRLLAITAELTCGVVNGRRMRVRPVIKPPWAEKRPERDLSLDEDITGHNGDVEPNSLLSKDQLKELSSQQGWPHFKDVFMLSSVDREDVETLKVHFIKTLFVKNMTPISNRASIYLTLSKDNTMAHFEYTFINKVLLHMRLSSVLVISHIYLYMFFFLPFCKLTISVYLLHIEVLSDCSQARSMAVPQRGPDRSEPGGHLHQHHQREASGVSASGSALFYDAGG